jgi:hypothetical protein
MDAGLKVLSYKYSSASIHLVFEDQQQASSQVVRIETEQFSMDEANVFL